MMKAEKEKKYILGIDTGGTYTDTVILELESKKLICEGKALTTKGKLDIGIGNSIRMLDRNCFDSIVLACLSTTLATNALIEGKVCKTGLILLGKELEEKNPADKIVFVHGKVDIKGNILEGINEKEILQSIDVFGENIEAIAISCFASVRNPQLELEIKRIIQKHIKKPVFCAHEVSGELGYYERTVTAVLNASLVKIIEDFLKATKSILNVEKINCPVMVVKGDGSLINEDTVRVRPIDTVLSGPAASIIGARHLTHLKDALVVDIGGTTSDIVLIDNGAVKIKDEGVTVGQWLTRTKAANVCTFGLGGDSIIKHNIDNSVFIGPEKVLPLCVAAIQTNNVRDALNYYSNKIKFNAICLYKKNCEDKYINCTEAEKLVLAAMEVDRVYHLKEIADILEISEEWVADVTKKLVKNEKIIKCSLTPTDILHAIGTYTEFNQEAPRLAVEIYARMKECSVEEYVDQVLCQIKRQIYIYILQSIVTFEGNKFFIYDDDTALYILDKAIKTDNTEFLYPQFKLNIPIIGVGASAHAWLPDVAKLFGTELLVPQYASVANAIGAALSEIYTTSRAFIRPGDKDGNVILFMPNERKVFSSESNAIDYAKKNLTIEIEQKIMSVGGEKPNIVVSVRPVYTQFFNSTKKSFVETVIDVVALSTPIIFGGADDF